MTKRQFIINDNTYKPSVFDRLGSEETNPNTTNKSGIDQQDPKQKGKQTNSLYNQDRDTNQHIHQHYPNRNNQISHLKSTPGPRQRGLAGETNTQPSTSSTKRQNSTPDLRQRGLAGENNKQYQQRKSDRDTYKREPVRYGREEKGKDAQQRDTSRESRNSRDHEQRLSAEFYNNWKSQNNKRQH